MPSQSPVTFEGRPLERREINMAARHQRNRNSGRMRKKRTQKKRKQARRKEAKKQKKHQDRKAGSRTVLNISSPRIFAAKILRQMPKVRMETKARSLMKTLLMGVYNHISKEVESLNQNNEQPIVDPSSVQAVLKEAMVKELARHKIVECMETKARELMITSQMDMDDHMSKRVESLNQNNEPPTNDPSDMQAALNEAMANELAKHTAEPTSNETTVAA